MSAWNDFVKKIFNEGRAKNGKSYSFKQALQDASERKSEMGKTASTEKAPKTKKSSTRKAKKGGKKTRKARKSKKH